MGLFSDALGQAGSSFGGSGDFLGKLGSLVDSANPLQFVTRRLDEERKKIRESQARISRQQENLQGAVRGGSGPQETRDVTGLATQPTQGAAAQPQLQVPDLGSNLFSGGKDIEPTQDSDDLKKQEFLRQLFASARF